MMTMLGGVGACAVMTLRPATASAIASRGGVIVIVRNGTSTCRRTRRRHAGAAGTTALSPASRENASRRTDRTFESTRSPWRAWREPGDCRGAAQTSQIDQESDVLGE